MPDGPASNVWDSRLNRRAAKTAGNPTYKGLPCKHCGGQERRTSNGQCVPCIRQDGRERAKKEKDIRREYRLKNKEKFCEYSKAYYARKKKEEKS